MSKILKTFTGAHEAEARKWARENGGIIVPRAIPGWSGGGANRGAGFVWDVIKAPTGSQPIGGVGQGVAAGVGGAGPNGAGSAADAIETDNPTIRLAGRSFELGPSSDNVVTFNRETAFRGIETAIPDSEITDALSPYCINFDGRVPGSLCVRKGMIKYSESRLTSQQSSNSNNALSSSYEGLDILWLEPNDNSGAANKTGISALVFADGLGIGAAGLANVQIATNGPEHAEPKDMVRRPGPSFTLTKNGSTADLAVSAYSGHPSTRNDIVKVSVLLSRNGYPESIEKKDDKETIDFQDTSGKVYDRTDWDGDAISETYDGTFTSGELYATAWAISREGISEPSYAKVTI